MLILRVLNVSEVVDDVLKNETTCKCQYFKVNFKVYLNMIEQVMHSKTDCFLRSAKEYPA